MYEKASEIKHNLLKPCSIKIGMVVATFKRTSNSFSVVCHGVHVNTKDWK